MLVFGEYSRAYMLGEHSPKDYSRVFYVTSANTSRLEIKRNGYTYERNGLK